jgi:hypothetical protein
MSLQYASEQLKNYYKIIFKAVKNNIFALRFASEELQYNKIFLIDCYKNINKKIKKFHSFLKYFDNIENNIFHNIEHFLNEHNDILHLIENKNFYKYLLDNNEYEIIYKNKELHEYIISYLLDNNKYEIIYKNEELHEYIKINKQILILSFNDLDPDNIYDKDELKLEYQERFKNFTLIFF